MVAALLLLVLVLTITVLIVMVCLCTRRCCRRMESNTQSPTANCVYYETAELDSVQMQISPVYASVDEAKCN